MPSGPICTRARPVIRPAAAARADRPAVALTHCGVIRAASHTSSQLGEFLQRDTQRLGHQLHPVEPTNRGQHMRGIGPRLPPALTSPASTTVPPPPAAGPHDHLRPSGPGTPRAPNGRTPFVNSSPRRTSSRSDTPPPAPPADQSDSPRTATPRPAPTGPATPHAGRPQETNRQSHYRRTLLRTDPGSTSRLCPGLAAHAARAVSAGSAGRTTPIDIPRRDRSTRARALFFLGGRTAGRGGGRGGGGVLRGGEVHRLVVGSGRRPYLQPQVVGTRGASGAERARRHGVAQKTAKRSRAKVTAEGTAGL